MSNPHSVRRRRFLLEWLALAAALTVFAMVLAYALYRAHEQTTLREADRLQGQARVVDENLTRQLQGANNALLGIRDNFERPGPDDGTGVSSARLKLLGSAMPGIRVIALLDAKGQVVASSRDELLGVDSSQRSYFDTPRRRADRSILYVSAPFRSALGSFVVAISRTLTDAQGEFAGVVVATLDPEYFQVILGSVLYVADMRAALAHGDGQVFVNMPKNERTLGMNLAQPGSIFARHQQSGRAASLVTGRVLATGDDRMMVVRTIHRSGLQMDKPIVAAVSRELAAIYQPWRDQAQRFGAFFALALFGASLGLLFGQRRRLAHERFAAAAAQQQKLVAERLARTAERLSLALEGSGLALFDWDLANDRIYQSAQASAMRGEQPVETTSSAADLRSFVHPDDLGPMLESLSSAVKGATPVYDVEFRVRQRSGDWRWLRSRGRVVERDDQGRALRLAGTHADINERKLAEERLRRLAEFDTLTELPNRAQFRVRMQQALANATRDSVVALMFLDIDHFKLINDTLGHDAGDQLLKVFAARMRECVRQSDTVARLGGDEFTIILEGLRDLRAAKAVAAQLIAALGQPITLAGKSLQVTASIGIAVWVPGDSDGPALLARADAALYEAKRRGRNRYFCDDATFVAEAAAIEPGVVSSDTSNTD